MVRVAFLMAKKDLEDLPTQNMGDFQGMRNRAVE